MTAEKPTPENDDRQWHWDKRVPIALILTIGIQTAGIAYWGGTISTRLDQVERRVEASAPQAERVIRLEEKIIRTEEKVSVVQKTVDEIKALLAGGRQR